MAAATTLPVLLDSLTQSLSSVFEATSRISSVEAPKDGISLLDVKNELLLSYLQNLIFLILVKLRKSKQSGSDDEDNHVGDDEVVKKLVELRLYLEKGVRPLEEKLRYQIERLLRAADNAERNEKAAQAAAASSSDSESSDEDSEEESQSEEDSKPAPNMAGLQARPLLGAMARRPAADAGGAKHGKENDGIYRPPKVAPTVMPTLDKREKRERGPIKSATMDEFVADELSTAPVAQPSIGTNIAQFGRRLKTASERKEEDERREYEERNFTRLPKESKKERAQKAARDGRRGRMDYGGEEWRDLGMGVDRINRMTNRKDGGGGTMALLDKSRKRGRDTVDGPRGSGEAGESYQKRLKVLESGRRDRGGKRR
jgi:U3 small nucleolar ribonucleoprotein protein LCP5